MLQVCRDVDPLVEGLMLGLAVSPDNRTAAAFTSNNQIVVLDVMLGTFRSCLTKLFQGTQRHLKKLGS